MAVRVQKRCSRGTQRVHSLIKGEKEKHTFSMECSELLFVKSNRYLYKLAQRKDNKRAWFGIGVPMVLYQGSDVQRNLEMAKEVEIT